MPTSWADLVLARCNSCSL